MMHLFTDRTICDWLKANHALVEEIHEINRRLIDTVVDISDEDVDPIAVAAADGGEGTIVKCSFSAVALSPNLKSQYASARMVRFLCFLARILVCHSFLLVASGLSLFVSSMLFQSPIQPLRLLIPTNYPDSSPILLDKYPVEVR